MTNNAANDFARFEHFLGFDWAHDEHDAVVVDRQGKIVGERTFSDDADGWLAFGSWLARFAQLAATIETSSGCIVERLLQLELPLFPVHPKAAERYRDRKAPAGTKNNLLDAYAIADALRTDGHAWRQLKPLDPLVHELRLLCRDEITLIEQRTALVNQLRATLREYYPAALEAFDDWTKPFAWRFLEQFPTPEKLVKAGKRQHEKFLRQHRLTSGKSFQERLDGFARADQFQGSAPITAAKSFLAVALAKQLLVLEEQLILYRQRIRLVFEQHPDWEIFESLPGAKDKLAPRLLAECGDDRSRFEDPQALQCIAGSAPVSFSSGKLHRVYLRRACNKILRATVHLWANTSRQACAWAEAYYQQKKAQGKTHACALRCLAQRWLKILWKMWQTGTLYDEALHLKNQTRHGSWVIQLLDPKTVKTTGKTACTTCS
jgi:transposase